MSHNKNAILSGIAWSYSERILAQVISLLISVILARILMPEDYGIIAIVIVFINILDAFVTSGFSMSLVQKKNSDDLDFNTACWFNVVLSIVLYTGLYMFAGKIASFYNMNQLLWIIRVMGFRIIISAFNSVQSAYVQRYMQFKLFFFSNLGGTIFSAVVGIWMAFQGFGVWALVGQYMASSFIGSFVLFFTIKWKPRLEFSWTRLKEMIGFSLRMLGATLINTLQDNIRSLVIGKVFTANDLAYFEQGKKYPAVIMNNLVGSIQKVLFPVFSEYQQETNQIKSRMRQAIRMSSFVIIPAVMGIIAIADTFVIVILTEKWLLAIPYLRIISVLYLTRTLNSIFQSALLAIGKSGVNMFHEVVGSALSIAMICIGAFGMKSVKFIAWSYIFVMLVGTAIFAYFVKKHFAYRFTEMFSDYFPYIVISSVMAGGVYLIGRLNIINYVVLLIIQIFIGIVIYVLLSALFRIDELVILKKLINKYKNKMLHGKKSETQR